MEQELITLGILFVCALAGGILASRFKQPMLLGLLVVGACIGPFALGLVKGTTMINLMIDFGAILLLFVIGLEFDVSQIKKIGLKAIVVGILKDSIVLFVGFNVALLLGLSVEAALFVGIILAFSSTVVIVKMLEEKNMMSRQEVPLLIGVLIIEDILAVIILTFFSGISNTSVGLIGSIQQLVISMCALVLTYLTFVKFGKPLVMWILGNNPGDEIITFSALAMCAGFSYLAYVLHLSPAAGAFLAGTIVASLPQAKSFEKAITPYNLIFSSFFFIAVGTLINFTAIKANIMLILILVLTVVITRFIAVGFVVYLFANFRGDKMFFSSMAMFSVGEFALLIAQESQSFNIGIDLMSISAAIVFITAVLMSLTLHHSDKIYAPTQDSIPWFMKKKVEKFANYIKSVSEELDLDNKYSKGLKSNVFSVLLFILFSLLLIFGWRSGSGIMEYYEISNIIIWISFMIVLGTLSVFLFYIMFKTQKVLKSLADIFANATNSKSVIVSRLVVKRAFLGSGLIILGLAFPFTMFLLHLKAIYVIVAFTLLILAGWQFHKISQEINGHHHESKLFDMFKSPEPHHQCGKNNVNNGWKF